MEVVEGDTKKKQTEQAWKRISHHFSHLSTNISLDTTSDSPVALSWPLISHLSDSPPASNFLRVTFQVRVCTKFGCTVGLVGNAQELGMWGLDRRVALRTDPQSYPVWTSAEVLVAANGKTLVLEYKYVCLEQVRVS